MHAGCVSHAASQMPNGYQMAGQDHEQRDVATCQNERYRVDANDSNEGTVKIGRPRAANE